MTVGWDAALVIATVVIAVGGLLTGVIAWFINRTFDGIRDELAELNAANQAREREHLELRARLPIDYVQREDWIRFSVGLDMKLDALRAEVRDRRRASDERG